MKGCLVYVPRSEREGMMNTLHLTHGAPESMLACTKDRVYWPNMRKHVHLRYQECKECGMFRISKTRPSNHFSNSFLQADFLEYDGSDYMLVVCTLTGYGRAYMTRNKGTEEAIRVM